MLFIVKREISKKLICIQGSNEMQYDKLSENATQAWLKYKMEAKRKSHSAKSIMDFLAGWNAALDVLHPEQHQKVPIQNENKNKN